MTESRHFFNWTPEHEATLAQLWAEGLACSKIARRMGTTKSAVQGKASRLKLPRRLSSYHTVKWASATNRPLPVVHRKPALSKITEYSAMPTVRKPCQFPMWGNEKPTHEYCGKNRVEGKPYCPEHAVRCYTKVIPKLGPDYAPMINGTVPRAAA